MNSKRGVLARIGLAALTLLSQTPNLPASAPWPVRARHGMVVSSQRLASEVGVKILQAGGNAIDAAVATGFALAVTHPSAGNLGGGGFMVVRTADGQVTSFDFREKAPAAATETMYLDGGGQYSKPLNHEGYLAVGVPGTVAGFALAHERLGSLPFDKLVEPAFELAEAGFPLSWALSDRFRELKDDFSKYPASLGKFFKQDGTPYEPGEVWRQPDLARSLDRIRKHGRDGFYQGETARLIAEAMRKNGGLITEQDLLDYQAKEREPIHGRYRGFDIFSMPPPSSGGVAIVEMLNILEGFDLKGAGHGSALHLHLLAESMRRAFADRARFLGDPDFNPEMPIARLLSKEHAADLRRGISFNRVGKSDPVEFNDVAESEETTHYSVIDDKGNAVVVTYTLEAGYGSKIVADGTGFLLNNEMGDFNPQPGRTDEKGLIGTPPNLVAPGKRMLSSMTPTIVMRDGRPFLLIGSPGGRTIINTVLQVVVNVIDFDMDVAEAIAAPRVHHQWLPDVLRIEKFGTSSDSLRLLRMIGHKIEEYDSSRAQGRAMGILVDPKSAILTGASDPRDGDGAAVGY